MLKANLDSIEASTLTASFRLYTLSRFKFTLYIRILLTSLLVLALVCLVVRTKLQRSDQKWRRTHPLYIILVVIICNISSLCFRLEP